MDIQTILLLIAIIGCFVGLGGWISGRDKKIVNDAEWRGTVNGKLDAILGIDKRMNRVEEDVKKQGNELCEVRQIAKSAHNRIDELKGIEK